MRYNRECRRRCTSGGFFSSVGYLGTEPFELDFSKVVCSTCFSETKAPPFGRVASSIAFHRHRVGSYQRGDEH